MQTVYTEALLKPMKKADLYEILLALGIDGVAKNAAAEEMIAKILAKNPPNDPSKDGGENDPANEPKEDEGTNDPPENETSNEGENEGEQGAYEPPDDDLPKYTPEQLIASSTYSHRRDVLRVILDDDKAYSHAQIAAMLKKFYAEPDKTLEKDGD